MSESDLLRKVIEGIKTEDWSGFVTPEELSDLIKDDKKLKKWIMKNL